NHETHKSHEKGASPEFSFVCFVYFVVQHCSVARSTDRARFHPAASGSIVRPRALFGVTRPPAFARKTRTEPRMPPVFLQPTLATQPTPQLPTGTARQRPRRAAPRTRQTKLLPLTSGRCARLS